MLRGAIPENTIPSYGEVFRVARSSQGRVWCGDARTLDGEDCSETIPLEGIGRRHRISFRLAVTH